VKILNSTRCCKFQFGSGIMPLSPNLWMGRRLKGNESEDLPLQKYISKLSGQKAENDTQHIVAIIPQVLKV